MFRTCLLPSFLSPPSPPAVCRDAPCHVDVGNKTVFRLELGAPFFIGHNPIPLPLLSFFMGFILSMMVIIILLFWGGALQFITTMFLVHTYTKIVLFLVIYINVAELQYTCLLPIGLGKHVYWSPGNVSIYHQKSTIFCVGTDQKHRCADKSAQTEARRPKIIKLLSPSLTE